MIKTTFKKKTIGWLNMVSLILAIFCSMSSGAQTALKANPLEGKGGLSGIMIETPENAELTNSKSYYSGSYSYYSYYQKKVIIYNKGVCSVDVYIVDYYGRYCYQGRLGANQSGYIWAYSNERVRIVDAGATSVYNLKYDYWYNVNYNYTQCIYINPDYCDNCRVSPGEIKSTQRNCGGFLPEEFTGTPAISNSGGDIVYQWQIKTDRNGSWVNIPGANGINYQPPYTASGSVWYRRAAKRAGCYNYCYSNVIDIHVKKLPEADVTVTNPDCGKQNGEIKFSFADTNGRTHIEFSKDGGTTYTTVPDDSGMFAFTGLGKGTYDIWVRWGNDDCPVDLGTITIEEKSISVDAGEDREICLGENSETTLTATVEGASNCTDCIEYAITDTDQCNRDENYVFWLTDGSTPRWFSNVDLVWTENADGTATLKGTIFDYTLTQSTYEVDATFTGKTNSPGSDPKAHICNDEDSSGWMYYTGLTGTVTSTDGSWVVNLSRRGPAFQMGNGANQTETEPGKFGACGWFNTTDSRYTVGDFNFNFGDCITETNEGIEYLWSTGETTQSITVSPDEDTTYTVTVTSCEGCVATDQVKVTVTSIDVNAGDDTNICLGEEVTLTATGEGSFEWSTGETTSSITVSPTETTTYTVTLTNGDCEATDDVTVTVEELSIDAGADQFICPGESVVLTAQGTTEGSCDTCVSYAITDTDYCRGNHNFVAWMKEDSGQRRWFSNVDLVWTENSDGTATLTGTMYDYFFSKKNFEVDVTFSGRTIVPPTGSPKKNDCNNEDTSGWIFYTEMNGTITQEDGSVVLDISRRGPAFQLGTGANNFETEAGKNGGSGWFDMSGGLSGIGDFNINFGECMTTEQTGVEYLWSTGETTQSITVSPTETTTYSVTLSNCADCVGTDDVTVVVSDYSIHLGNDKRINQGDSVVLTLEQGDADSYLWSTGETTPSITVSPDQTTTYTLTTTKDGCSATDSVNVHVEIVDSTASADPCVSQQYEITATPIPVNASGTMNVDVAVDADQNIAYEIYNGANPVGQGATISVNRGCNNFTIDLGPYGLQSGANYILLIQGNGWNESIQFITQ